MKRLILFEIILIFFATTFDRDSPPGWFQQSLPVNDVINDIFFIDSLNGWVATNGNFPTNDTAYIMHTSDGGNSWSVQNIKVEKLNTIQFLDVNTGYAMGGLNGTVLLSIYKTTNSGTNWTALNNLSGTVVNDFAFVNKDTGWISVQGNFMSGILMTTDGASTWQLQYTQTSHLGKIFMLSKDTGWFVTAEANGRLFRTTNGGVNWGLQYAFSSHLIDLFFVNNNTGFVSGGFGSHSIKKTVDGGSNWSPTTNSQGAYIYFINNSIGYCCTGASIVQRSSDGGETWYRQTVPTGGFVSIVFIDTSKGWAGGNILIHTTDGGGPPLGIVQTSNELPEDFILYQNYPNPFNPKTNVKFQITGLSHVKIVVYDIRGREIKMMVNEKLNSGTYETDFDASALSSGIYLYSLFAGGKLIGTKKMLLMK